MTLGTFTLPNGYIIRQRAAPMPIVPRSRICETEAMRAARIERELSRVRSREIYDRPIGPQNRVTLPYAVEALLKLTAPLPIIAAPPRGDDEPPPVMPPTRVTAAQIVRAVRQAYDIDMTDLLSIRRHRSTVRARQVCYWMVKRYTSLSLPQIGRHLGGRDHTTVLHGARVIDRLLKADTPESENIRFVIDRCRRELGLVDDH